MENGGKKICIVCSVPWGAVGGGNGGGKFLKSHPQFSRFCEELEECSDSCDEWRVVGDKGRRLRFKAFRFLKILETHEDKVFVCEECLKSVEEAMEKREDLEGKEGLVLTLQVELLERLKELEVCTSLYYKEMEGILERVRGAEVDHEEILLLGETFRGERCDLLRFRERISDVVTDLGMFREDVNQKLVNNPWKTRKKFRSLRTPTFTPLPDENEINFEEALILLPLSPKELEDEDDFTGPPIKIDIPSSDNEFVEERPKPSKKKLVTKRRRHAKKRLVNTMLTESQTKILEKALAQVNLNAMSFLKSTLVKGIVKRSTLFPFLEPYPFSSHHDTFFSPENVTALDRWTYNPSTDQISLAGVKISVLEDPQGPSKLDLKCSECGHQCSFFFKDRPRISSTNILYNLQESMFNHVHGPKHLNMLLCPLCPFQSNTLRVWQGHKAIHEDPSVGTCSICGQKFNFPDALRQHKMTHNKQGLREPSKLPQAPADKPQDAFEEASISFQSSQMEPDEEKDDVNDSRESFHHSSEDPPVKIENSSNNETNYNHPIKATTSGRKRMAIKSSTMKEEDDMDHLDQDADYVNSDHPESSEEETAKPSRKKSVKKRNVKKLPFNAILTKSQQRTLDRALAHVNLSEMSHLKRTLIEGIMKRATVFTKKPCSSEQDASSSLEEFHPLDKWTYDPSSDEITLAGIKISVVDDPTEPSNWILQCSDCGHQCSYLVKDGTSSRSGATIRYRLQERMFNHVHGPKHLNMFKCPLCDFQGTGLRNWQGHKSIHEDPAAGTCSICNLEFNSVDAMRKHKALHLKSELPQHTKGQQAPADKRTPYQCSTCGKFCCHSRNLKDHEETHKTPEEKVYVICSLCGERMPRAAYPYHKVKAHKPKHLCPVCGQTFQHLSYVRYHMKNKHGEGAAVQCDVCGGYYKKLAEHKQTMHPDKEQIKYFCGKGCGRWFKRVGCQQNHEAKCNGTRPKIKYFRPSRHRKSQV